MADVGGRFMRFLGLDVGTTSVKAAVFDENGGLCGYGRRNYHVLFLDGQRAQQDACGVWEHAKESIIEATREEKRIDAISISVQGDAIIPVGYDRRPLYDCLLGMDYRAEAQSSQCEQKLGAERLFKLTGMRPHPLNSLSKILWFEQERPELAERIWKYMTYEDFFLMKLGVESPVVDLTMASRYMALDLLSGEWSEEILGAIGLSESKLSHPCQTGSLVGELSDVLAKELGLHPKVPIIAGGHDQTCGALGAGMTQNDGGALDSHGTAEVLSAAFDEPRLTTRMFSSYYPCTRYAQNNRFFTFALNHTGGVLFQWFLEAFCEKDMEMAKLKNEDPFAYMIARIPMDRPSAVLALPHFNGRGTPRCDLQSKGAFAGLTMHTTREEMLKAIIDALAYEMKLNLAAFKEAGVHVSTIRCVGGAAKSEDWLQLKADVLNVPVETLKTREAACLGAAMLAAIGSGVYSSLEQAARNMVHVHCRYIPIPERNERYEKSFAIYSKLYDALKEIHHAMGEGSNT